MADSRFLDLLDPTKHAAFATVRNLVAEYDDDTVRRAFAEVVAAKKLKRWSDGYSLSAAKGKQCPTRAAGLRCRGETCAGCAVPVADHGTLWSYGRKPVVYVAQPYGISPVKFEALSAWCSTNGFRCRVDVASSWRFPGGSLLVALAPADGRFWSLEWKPAGRRRIRAGGAA